jgi:hypothetical protein
VAPVASPEERRDLAGIEVGYGEHTATVHKGGLPMADTDLLKVRYEYRDRTFSVIVGQDATEAQVSAAIASVLPEIDDTIDLEELVGGEV